MSAIPRQDPSDEIGMALAPVSPTKPRLAAVSLRHVLMAHAFLMLSLGTALFCLATLITNPSRGVIGYSWAGVLTAVSLAVTAGYLTMAIRKERRRCPVAVYVMVGIFSIACWFIFWITQSTTLETPLLVLLAGGHGVVWGLWYVRLAVSLPEYPKKAGVLFSVAAATTSIGIVIASQSEITRLGAVTIVAGYSMLIGIQLLVTGMYLNRECEAGGKLLSDGVKRSELEVVETCAVTL